MIIKTPQIFSEKFFINDIKIDFQFRNQSVGDLGVIRQVFKQKCYSLSSFKQSKNLNLYYDNLLKNNNVPLIIDAGANIGASSIFFKCWYQKSYLYAVEPEHSNNELFKKNLKSFFGWYLFEGALTGKCKKSKLRREGSDWGHRLVSKGSIDVDCINIDFIFNQIHKFQNNFKPFICKIDIEGGESDLFSDDNLWLDKFPLVIIELHDWMFPFSGISKNFQQAIAKFEFDFLIKGENIFLFNRNLLAKFFV